MYLTKYMMSLLNLKLSIHNLLGIWLGIEYIYRNDKMCIVTDIWPIRNFYGSIKWKHWTNLLNELWEM